jgi:hypothetical protein
MFKIYKKLLEKDLDKGLDKEENQIIKSIHEIIDIMCKTDKLLSLESKKLDFSLKSIYYLCKPENKIKLINGDIDFINECIKVMTGDLRFGLEYEIFSYDDEAYNTFFKDCIDDRIQYIEKLEEEDKKNNAMEERLSDEMLSQLDPVDIGGKKTRKGRKGRKGRKTRKGRKSRKGRKGRKCRKTRK